MLLEFVVLVTSFLVLLIVRNQRFIFLGWTSRTSPRSASRLTKGHHQSEERAVSAEDSRDTSAQTQGWDDLPVELLLEIAQRCGHAGSTCMFRVCKAWKLGLETASTNHLTILGSHLPLTLGGPDFSSLAELDLRGCTVASASALSALEKGPPLTSLSLGMDVGDLTGAVVQAVRDIKLTKLSLELSGRAPISAGSNTGWLWKGDTGAEWLRKLEKLPVTRLHSSCLLPFTASALAPLRKLPLVTDLSLWLTIPHKWDDYFTRSWALRPLRGLPLTALRLAVNGIWMDDDLAGLRGLPLTLLELSSCRYSDDPNEPPVKREMAPCEIEMYMLANCINQNITGKGIKALKGMQLKTLHIRAIPGIDASWSPVLRDMPLESFHMNHGLFPSESSHA